MAQDFPDGLNLGVALKLPMARPKEPYATCEEALVGFWMFLVWVVRVRQGFNDFPGGTELLLSHVVHDL